jgi:DNA polymerase-3 subunit delta
VGEAADADVQILILREGAGRRIVALSGTGRVRELEIIYTVRFAVREAQRTLIDANDIEFRTQVSYDDSSALSKEQEIAALTANMQKDAATQIIRRTSAVRRAACAHGDRPGLWTVIGSEPLLVLEAADRIRAAARSAGFEERSVLILRWRIRLGPTGCHRQQPVAVRQPPADRTAHPQRQARRRRQRGHPPLLRAPAGGDGDPGQHRRHRLVDPQVGLVPCPRGCRQRARLAARRRRPNSRAGSPGVWPAQSQRADAETLDFLAARVEGNLPAARQELDKLALLFPPGALDGAAVREAVLDVARHDPQQWVDALLGGDIERAGRVLGGLAAEGAAIPSLVWLLADHLAAVWAVLDAGGRIDDGLRRAHRLYGERGQSIERAARRCSLRQVERAVRTLAMAERGGKGLEPLHDVWQMLAQLGVLLGTQVRRAA